MVSIRTLNCALKQIKSQCGLTSQYPGCSKLYPLRFRGRPTQITLQYSTLDITTSHLKSVFMKFQFFFSIPYKSWHHFPTDSVHPKCTFEWFPVTTTCITVDCLLMQEMFLSSSGLFADQKFGPLP